MLLAALLNYGQTRCQRFPDRDCDDLELTRREFLFGIGRGRPTGPGESQNAPLSHEGCDLPKSMLDQPVRTD